MQNGLHYLLVGVLVSRFASLACCFADLPRPFAGLLGCPSQWSAPWLIGTFTPDDKGDDNWINRRIFELSMHGWWAMHVCDSVSFHCKVHSILTPDMHVIQSAFNARLIPFLCQEVHCINIEVTREERSSASQCCHLFNTHVPRVRNSWI